MSLITLTSAAGAPGVTTTALALALAWPRPVVLVEADPVGGSALSAGYLGGRIPHHRGLLDLVVAHRQNRLLEALTEVMVDLPDTSVHLIPGARSNAQAATIATIMEPLTTALKALERDGVDVIVDAGRLGMQHYPASLRDRADLALLLLRTTRVAVGAARGWTTTLRTGFEAAGAADNVAAVLVGEGRPHTEQQVAKVIDLPIAASLAWDPVSAEVYHLGAAPRRRFDTAPLPRSVAAAVSAFDARLTASKARLDAATTLEGA